MGKKHRGYDQEAVRDLAEELKAVRRPPANKQISSLNIDEKKLEEAVLQLPKKHREALERYWGLVPGTIKHSRRFKASKLKDTAFENMKAATLEAIKELLCVEYLHIFDRGVEILYRKMLEKVDRTGVEDMSDIDIMKYLMLYKIFIEGGPRLFYEEADEAIDIKSEAFIHIDQYMLLKLMWEKVGVELPDNSINMKLLVETVSMFDYKDVLTMKKFVRLPVKKDEDEGEKLTASFKDVRLFKEKIFPYGPWNITTKLVYRQRVKPEELEEIQEFFSVFRSDFKSVGELEQEGKANITTSQGVQSLRWYKIANLPFYDVDEFVSLYINRRILQL